MSPGSVDFFCSVVYPSPENDQMLSTTTIRESVHKAPLFQLNLSVFLDEFAWHAEADCYDVLEVVTTDSVTSAHIRAGHDLQTRVSMD